MCIITSYVSRAMCPLVGPARQKGMGEYLLNSLGYKFFWFVRGVLLALLNPAARQTRTIPAGATQPYFISPVHAFVGYPNGDTVWYGIRCFGGR